MSSYPQPDRDQSGIIFNPNNYPDNSSSGGLSRIPDPLTVSTINVTNENVSNNLIVSNRLGIQKSSPSYELDVSGNINCTGKFKLNGVDVPAISDPLIVNNLVVSTQTT